MGQGFALSSPDENQTQSTPQEQPININEIQANLSSYFADLPDPRVSRTQKHLLKDILALAILAVIGGAPKAHSSPHLGWEDMENSRYSQKTMARRIPMRLTKACFSFGAFLLSREM